MFPGATVIRLPTVDSTNNYAAMLLKTSKVAEGTAIMADEQTHGRGQRGNSWQSEDNKNLTVSFVFYPTFLETGNYFLWSMAVSLAVRKLVHVQGVPNVSVKWPNDVLVGTKKIAGILIENAWNAGRLQSSIVGIGLNVNQLRFGDKVNATSLHLLVGQEFSRKRLLEILSSYLQKAYIDLLSAKLDSLRSEYHQYLYGKDLSKTFFLANGTEFTGIVREVSDNGKIMIERESGLSSFEMKDITWSY